MPTNKNAQLRYQILDRCFSDFTRKYTFEDLLDEVNDKLYDITGSEVSVRTLRDDIKYLKDRVGINAPIKAFPISGRKSYYRYDRRNYSIFKNDLSVDEVKKLGSVVEILKRFRGNPKYAWVEETINDLECRFGLKANTELSVDFEKNEQLKGLEFLPDIIDATIYHQTLAIKYQSFRGPERNYIFHPYFVKQYNNRWFLFGKIDRRDSITDLALDRIIELHESNVPFTENSTVDFATYFDDILGVTKIMENQPERITLKFDEKRFPYIVNKPIHKSQRVLSTKEHTIQLTLRYNSELEAQIFYYGPQVEVLEPLWLRQQIIEKIEENLKKYSIVQKDCTIES